MNTTYALDDLKNLTHVLPIDKSLKEGERTMLSVRVPGSFQALQPIEQLNKSGMAEFIPSSDKDPFAWTQILTIYNFPFGKKVLAKDFLNEIKNQFFAADPNIKIMNESYEETSYYNVGKLTMSYTPGKERDEIVIMEYYCGTQECSAIQYAILLKPNEDKNLALNKMHDFLKTNKVINIATF